MRRDIKEIENDRDNALKELGKITYGTMRLAQQLHTNEKKAEILHRQLDAIREEMIKSQEPSVVDENRFAEKAP